MKTNDEIQDLTFLDHRKEVLTLRQGIRIFVTKYGNDDFSRLSPPGYPPGWVASTLASYERNHEAMYEETWDLLCGLVYPLKTAAEYGVVEKPNIIENGSTRTGFQTVERQLNQLEYRRKKKK